MLVPLSTEHLPLMANHGGQEKFLSVFSTKHVEDLINSGPTYAAVQADGSVIGVGGLVEMNEYRALGWGMFARTTPANFLKIHRAVYRTMVESKYKRIEAYVDPEFPQAIRWIEQLGFKMEQAFVRYYFPDGSGASFWAWHK